MVKVENHGERCKVGQYSDRTWNDTRVLAWYGDTIHKLDVQLALHFLGVPQSIWGERFAYFTTNQFMASYMRRLGLVERSEHTLGTAFEAQYVQRLRETWLYAEFPTVARAVLQAWTPPVDALIGYQLDPELVISESVL